MYLILNKAFLYAFNVCLVSDYIRMSTCTVHALVGWVKISYILHSMYALTFDFIIEHRRRKLSNLRGQKGLPIIKNCLLHNQQNGFYVKPLN